MCVGGVDERRDIFCVDFEMGKGGGEMKTGRS